MPDVPVCTEIHLSKGFCTNTISAKEFFIDDEHPYIDPISKKSFTWWDLRPQLILLPHTSWAAIKEFVIKVCKKSGQCDQEVANWERTIETIETRIIDHD